MHVSQNFFATDNSLVAFKKSELFFRTGRLNEAHDFVKRWHYSKRWPGNVQIVGSLHRDGGLFGGDGPMVAACIFSIPPTRWKLPVIELTRLARAEAQVPLSWLISETIRIAKLNNYDLAVSFADKTQNHEGYVYRASNWKYHGLRSRRLDGAYINETFIPGRSLNSKHGTQSIEKLKRKLPNSDIKPHYDLGKHLYWYPITKTGKKTAAILKLENNSWK